MEFKKVEIEIPSNVKEVYEKIRKIQPNSCIAGGFLCDLFIGKDFKDVDFFIKHDKEKNEEIQKLFAGFENSETSSREGAYGLASYPGQMTVKGYNVDGLDIQLIFTEFGIKAVKYFDTRFREFIYFKEDNYASVEALEDIRKRRLVFGVTKSPLKALYRILKFQKKYGFKIDTESYLKLKAYFNESSLPEKSCIEYVQTKVSEPDIKETLIDMFQKESGKYSEWRPSRFRKNKYEKEFPDVLTFLRGKQIQRDDAEKLFLKGGTNTKFTFEMSENPFIEAFRDCVRLMKEEMEKQQIRLTLHYPSYVETWKHYLNQLETSDDMIEMNKVIEQFYRDIYFVITKSYIFKTRELFYSCRTMFYQAKDFKPTIYVTMGEKLSLQGLNSIGVKRYLKGNIAEFRFSKYGYFLYDLKMKKIIYNETNSFFLKKAKTYIEEYLN